MVCVPGLKPVVRAVICGCNAGLFREALHEVYTPRIQRGDASFTANVLGARGPLLSALVHFFEDGHWGTPVEMGVEEHRLTAEDQLFILMQAGLHLTATRRLGAPEARFCYECAESLCHSLNRPRFLYVALVGQWRYSLQTDKMSAAMQMAERVYSLAQEQNDSALMMGACRPLAATLYFMGDFETRPTIRDAWCSDVALGKCTVSGRRGHVACCHLSRCRLAAYPCRSHGNRSGRDKRGSFGQRRVTRRRPL
jgi:hypothetical protein